ncbi:glycosyltransferase [Kiritimatiella glycovorans]|uniref:Sugar transferase, PEP-CTERM/EpsH1 system associated n=1 Tax=Kiritimatiella glycovorans TaxID=1307763 RepID=A0A0G3EB17_9BACT|nr:glycosyltransferase [Kiritimatiella glycovorans]AKJ63478.1 sugar transferase, PEP-CTERM/EpsH1 system associated [Kiritimatiella glycovorans]
MPRILIITPLLPLPADTGSRLRFYHLARCMADAGMEVSMLALDGESPAGSEPSAPDFLEHFEAVCDPGPRLSPPGAVVPAYREFRAAVYRALDAWHPEAVQIEKTFAFAQCGVRTLRNADMPVLLDEGGVHHLGYRREAARARGFAATARAALRAARLRRYEARAVREVDAVTAVSPGEAEHLRALAPSATVIEVPNGVDERLFERAPAPFSRRETGLFFCGDYRYAPNADAVRWFLRRVRPELDRRGCRVPLVAAGAHPPDDLRARAERDEAFDAPGRVPDIHACYERYTMMINPMRSGAGTRLKMLEAMAHGMACISTAVGAEGLGIEDGREARIADSPSAMAAAIEAWAADRDAAEEAGRHARAAVRERFVWPRCAQPLIDFYRGRLGEGTAGA